MNYKRLGQCKKTLHYFLFCSCIPNLYCILLSKICCAYVSYFEDISARQATKKPGKKRCKPSKSVPSTKKLASNSTSYPSNPLGYPTFNSPTYPTRSPGLQLSYPLHQPYPLNQPSYIYNQSFIPSHEPSHFSNPSDEPSRHSYRSNQLSSPLRTPPFSFSQSTYHTSYSRSSPTYRSYQPSYPSYSRSLSPFSSNQHPSCKSNPP